MIVSSMHFSLCCYLLLRHPQICALKRSTCAHRNQGREFLSRIEGP